jgi:hypothetical protein
VEATERFVNLTNSRLLTWRQENEEGASVMKRFKVMFGMLVMALLLVGCATTSSNTDATPMVKCPLCGHEFAPSK